MDTLPAGEIRRHALRCSNLVIPSMCSFMVRSVVLLGLDGVGVETLDATCGLKDSLPFAMSKLGATNG